MNKNELLAYPVCEAYIAKTEQDLEVLRMVSKMVVLEQKWLDKYYEPSKLSTEIKALLAQVKDLKGHIASTGDGWQQWEYKTYWKGEHDAPPNLAEFGKGGWELCSAYERCFYFKRKLPQPPENS